MDQPVHVHASSSCTTDSENVELCQGIGEITEEVGLPRRPLLPTVLVSIPHMSDSLGVTLFIPFIGASVANRKSYPIRQLPPRLRIPLRNTNHMKT